MEEKRILDAIKASGVTRIAFVDDVFDAPDIPEVDWGELLQYLNAPNAEDVREAAGIKEVQWQAAIDGLHNSDQEPVDELIRKLYSAYVFGFDDRLDPMGRFAAIKGANLRYVRPLLALVRKASPEVTIQTYGSEMDVDDSQDGPHVVFVDLFLHPDVSPDAAPNMEQAKDAADESLKRIKPLLSLSPSVILMSSHPDAPQVTSYRQGMEEQSRVFASRFGFVDKKLVTEDAATGMVSVDPKVSDVLLDLFQTYKFGRGLHDTLSAWVMAANQAVQVLKGEIDDLRLADLAYLVRFRLAEEGQSLTDYLEWLLGECLLDQVGRELDKGLTVTHIDKETKVIDGAFDGPTRKVAELYHRVRIENKRNRPREHFRLGDLYLRNTEHGVRHLVAIMNPDCDLVKRPGEAKPAAHAIITLQGKLESFTAPNTSIGDFIVIKDQPHNIKWDFRKVETLPFDGVMAQPGQSDLEFDYLGALRPMYAQEIQTKLLSQLRRVGVPVPPVVAFASSIALHYAAKGGQLRVIEFPSDDAPCYFVPPRQSGQEGVLVFRRQFVRKLIDALKGIDQEALSNVAVGQLKVLLSDKGIDKLHKLTSEGIVLEKDMGYGLLLTKKKAKIGDKSAHWGCLVVGMKTEVSHDTAIQEEAVIASAGDVAEVAIKAIALSKDAHVGAGGSS